MVKSYQKPGLLENADLDYTEIYMKPLASTKKLIIFDFDGVLRSASWEGLFAAYCELAKNSDRDYRMFFTGLDEFKNWWNPDWKKNNKNIGIIRSEITDKIFYDIYEPYTALFPWVPETIECLSQKYTLAIASNGSEKSNKNCLGNTARYFSLIAGAGQVAKLKPDPEIINFIIKKLGFLPSETTMIGDMDVDILAGKNAGTKTGAVSWGLGDWENLTGLNPDHQFTKPNDLLSI